MKLTKADLPGVLSAAQNLKVTRVVPLTQTRVLLGFEWTGGQATATFDAVELVNGEDSRWTVERRDDQLHSSEISDLFSSKVWTEEDLRRQGLPLWWNKEWLEAQLQRASSYRALAAELGELEQVMSEWGRRHGIHVKPRKSPAEVKRIVAQLVEDIRSGANAAWPSVPAHAEALGVSQATLSRWRKLAREQFEAGE